VNIRLQLTCLIQVLSVGTARSDGYNSAEVRGTYQLASLLQELTIAKDMGRTQIILDSDRLSENPVKRLSRFIETMFWDNLTRRIDGGNIAQVAVDSKDWTSDPRPRIYVPQGAPEQYEYYCKIAKQHPEMRLDVCWLAKNLTPEYIRDLAPGLLAVGMDEVIDEHGEKTLQGKPFIVPGGRFNEFYGWDSYMATLGLLVNNRIDICKSMVENFVFCIKHYGKIFNANRSYYLGRSQPPFLTDMILRVYATLPPKDPATKEFLHQGVLAAIKEYYNVWVSDPRIDKVSGLSRYRPFGIGVPPETEATHFEHLLEPYAKKHGLSQKEFIRAYNMQEIKEPSLDEYFLHDRAVRESGHDTSYRLEKVAADLATVDLNSCLYKIEVDISRILRASYNNAIAIPDDFLVAGMQSGHVETSASWERRAKRRRVAMDRYMWNEEKGMYFDYNTKTKQRTTYESATTFWAMWSGVATPRQAAAMVITALPNFEMYGGLVSGTESSRGHVGLDRPSRQWDFPFGWAPHQILAWHGFQRYGFQEEAERLAYRWCHMVTKAFVDFNGIVVEKYDLTRIHDPQRVEAEYGNQGADFKGVPKEGFGWVNASYVVGLDILNQDQLKALGTLINWEAFSGRTADRDLYGLEIDKLHTGYYEQAVAEHGIEHLPSEYAQPHHGSHHGASHEKHPSVHDREHLAEQEHAHGPEIPVHNEKEDKLAHMAGPHGNGSYMTTPVERKPSGSEGTRENAHVNNH
jgi:alpha,alpha-trehalase